MLARLLLIGACAAGLATTSAEARVVVAGGHGFHGAVVGPRGGVFIGPHGGVAFRGPFAPGFRGPVFVNRGFVGPRVFVGVGGVPVYPYYPYYPYYYPPPPYPYYPYPYGY
jgi:hypothetical protein